jgi:NADH dehydrogenase
MASRVFVTGGSGFVGSAVIDELVGRGHSVHALVNREPVHDRDGRVRSFPGGLFDAAALDAGLAGCDAVIHLVGIIFERPGKGITFERMHFEGAKAVIDAAKRGGVRRFLHMSALGVRANAASEYHRTKWKAEEQLRNSGLDWTIFRPGLIHGPRGEFMQMEAAWARKNKMPFLFMPYFGRGVLGFGGSGLIQPVYVKEVARAFADALEKTNTIGQTYEIAGPDRMDWTTMHRLVARTLTGKPRATLPVPAWYAKALTFVVPQALLPFNRAQVIMSQEDNTCDLRKFESDFGWSTQKFDATLLGYKDQL